MKFTSEVIQVLKNYSTINHGILFIPGDTLSTIASSKTIMASAKIDIEIPKEFAIYDLSRFLATLSLFKDPDLKFEDNQVVISEGKRKIKYTYADPNTIVVPPRSTIKFPEAEVEFEISSDALQELVKAMNVLSLPEIVVVGDGENIEVKAADSQNPTADTYSVRVGSTEDKFMMVIRGEYIKLLPNDYKVEISSKGLSRFTSEQATYYIAVEANSKFG